MDSNANETSPTWSPDGRQLAYLSDESGTRQLYIINSDGTGKWKVTSEPHAVGSVTWSPDSQYILYVQGNIHPTDLFKCKLNSSRDGIEQCWNLTSEPVTSWSLYWASPQLAPGDCNHIAASRAYNGWPRLRTIEDRDADATESDWTAIGKQYGMSVNPSWNPDDCLIAYAFFDNYQTWNLGDVYTIESDGANDTKIVDRSVTGQHVESVAWSPDGNCIVFSEQYRSASRLGIVCSDSNGVWPDPYDANSVKWLDDPCSAIPPQKYSWQADIWSPDGDTLVYSRNVNGRWDIWLVTNSGSERTPVVESEGNDRDARFSVDGVIAFHTDRNGNWDIYTATAAAEDIIYVDDDASPGGDGKSWGTAYKYLQDALNRPPAGGDQIWVAEGIYKPDLDEGGNFTAGDRTATFQLISGVAVYGGYAGAAAPDPNARDIDLYKTTLSGDLNGDDGPDFADNGENSYHVVNGSGTDETAVLDGFTITAGNANGTSLDSYAGGMYNEGGSPTINNCIFSRNFAHGIGAGMYNGNNSPTLTNCTFIGNSTNGNGGGMLNYHSSLTLTRCTFSGNSANIYGGGMQNHTCSPTVTDCTFSRNSGGVGGGMYNNFDSSPKVTNCTFIGNSAITRGGGMYSRGGSQMVTGCTFSGNLAADMGGGMYNYESTPTLTNCTFSGNSAQSGGGMINLFNSLTLINCIFSSNSADAGGGGIYNEESSPVLTNCTFSGNSAADGNALACDSYQQLGPSNVEMTNCILWDGGGEIWNNDGSAITINYSDVQGGWGGPGGSNIDEDPLFIGPNGLDGIPGTADDGYNNLHLSPTISPCINVGDPSGDYTGQVDLDGQPRLAYGRVDMGADEVFPIAGDFEPDGDVDFGDLDIFVMNWMVTSDPDSVGDVAWSSDSQYILYTQGDVLPTGLLKSKLNSSRVGIEQSLNLNSESVTGQSLYGASPQLARRDRNQIADRDARFSVDGTIAFRTGRSGNSDIYTTVAAAGDIIYVDDDASLGGDGQSWGTAYKYLQDALSEPPASGDQIWVAEGTYKPDHDEGGSFTAGDRTATFQLVSGVAICGGYAGADAPDPNDRDIDLYKTTLSGDLNGDDAPDFANNGENSYHVVNGSGTDETAVLDGFTITAGNANGTSLDSYAGGMYNEGGSPTVTNCIISRNFAHGIGAGMYNGNNSPVLTNCTFIGNSTNNNGGGMLNYHSSPKLTGCTFSGNSANVYCGGMYNYDSNSTVTDCKFSHNTGGLGGGMLNNYGSSPTVTNCTFIGNSSSNDGGGMYNREGSPTVTGCTFSDNLAADQGGGMYNYESSPTVTDCTFSNNTAPVCGGMYNFYYSNPTVTNCAFRGNSTGDFGGGMSNFKWSSPTVTNCIFSGNSADWGGGMYNEQSSPTVTNCTFSGNTADCGGMYNFSSSPTVTSCTFSGNTATFWGGGMFNQESSPTVTNCTFSGNTAYEYGGGMYNYPPGSSPTVTGCTFSGNLADAGGGIYNEESTPTLTNCTFRGNSAASGNALACDSYQHLYPGTVEMTSCILWDGGGGIWNNDGSTITINYSDVQGGWGGPGGNNIDEDPLFIGPNGLDGIPGTADDEDDNLHLSPSFSPCINVGDPSGDYGEQVDLDGQPRLAYGRVDMGADEVFSIAGDFEPDGDVDFGDFAIFALNWLLGVE